MIRGANPTVREVAERAGVSPMTVSRTLAGGKNVRPELQERVLAAIDDLGYRRNENARSLRPGHSSRLIGIAITNLANPYYGSFASGVEQVAGERGRRIQLGSTRETVSSERGLISDFVGRQVEGLIVVPVASGGEHLAPVALRGTPLVLASRLAEGVSADAVLLDDVGGAREAVRAILERGHRRIGYLGPDEAVFTSKRRYEGYARALAEAGIAPDPALVRHGQTDVDAAAAVATHMLDADDAPTAFFGANNRNAIGALNALLARRGDADDSMLASFDEFELSNLVRMPLAVVQHDPRELGRIAAEMLFDRIEDRVDGEPRLRQLPVHVVTLN